MHTSSDAALLRPGPKLPELTLTDEERDTLERWTRRASSSQALALRSRIVLACAGPECTPAGDLLQIQEHNGWVWFTTRVWGVSAGDLNRRPRTSDPHERRAWGAGGIPFPREIWRRKAAKQP